MLMCNELDARVSVFHYIYEGIYTMSESVTPGHPKPQKPASAQTSAPAWQSASAANADATATMVAVPPKITTLPLTAAIISWVYALVRLAEFGFMIVALGILKSTVDSAFPDSLRNYQFFQSFAHFLLFLILCSIVLNMARIIMTIVAIGDSISLALHAVFVSEASVHIAREWLTYASDLAPTFSILTVIYELLVIANIVLLVFLWLPGTNIFMRQAKTYRLALNTTAQSVTGQRYER